MAKPAVTKLINWKIGFLRGKITAINARIALNNGRIRALRRMPDTQDQIESFEHQNAGLEEDKKEVQDELDRFNKGSAGKKYNMARRNIGNEIHRLQLEADHNLVAAAAALAAAGLLINIDNAAADAIQED